MFLNLNCSHSDLSLYLWAHSKHLGFFIPIVRHLHSKKSATQRPAKCASAVPPDFKTVSLTILILPHTHNNKKLKPSIRSPCFHNRQCYLGIFKLRSPSSIKLSAHKPFKVMFHNSIFLTMMMPKHGPAEALIISRLFRMRMNSRSQHFI